jgi:hypothetical protein
MNRVWKFIKTDESLFHFAKTNWFRFLGIGLLWIVLVGCFCVFVAQDLTFLWAVYPAFGFVVVGGFLHTVLRVSGKFD